MPSNKYLQGLANQLMLFLPARTMLEPGELAVMPRWFSSRAISMYFAALGISSVLFYSHMMEWFGFLWGIVSVVCFFQYSGSLSRQWCRIRSPKAFERKLFSTALIIRIVYVLVSFLFYQQMMPGNSGAWEFNHGDVTFYDEAGRAVADGIRAGSWNLMDNLHKGYGDVSYDDSGYAMYLGVVYFFTGNSILMARLLKAIWSAFTAVLIYRLASRCFGEQTGRLAGVFCMLMPNLIYYCGLHLKETEMTFMCVYYVEQGDQMLRSKQFSVWKLLPMLVVGAVLFMFRSPLGVIAILSLFFTLAISSERMVSWGKRIVVALLAISLVGLSMGNRVQEQVHELTEKVSGGEQRKNMEWRSRRVNGNQFAKYAGAAVFAPLIFTIPFPSMTATPNQENQRMIHGGNYVKNVLSICVIMAMLLLLFTDEWRKYTLPISFMLGYLVVLAMSTFAQSERFHLPILPLELMFAAYLLPLMGRPSKRVFNMWTILLVVICIGWQWFKLKGRGMV